LAPRGGGPTAEPPDRTDLSGDPLPPGATTRLGTARWRAEDGVSQMAFLPDDRYLATSAGVALTVRAVDTGRVVRAIGGAGNRGASTFQSFAFTPDGNWLLSADPFGRTTPAAESGRNARLLLWDFSSGEVLAESDISGVPTCLAIRPGG